MLGNTVTLLSGNVCCTGERAIKMLPRYAIPQPKDTTRRPKFSPLLRLCVQGETHLRLRVG